jgi:hypothetical protein
MANRDACLPQEQTHKETRLASLGTQRVLLRMALKLKGPSLIEVPVVDTPAI